MNEWITTAACVGALAGCAFGVLIERGRQATIKIRELQRQHAAHPSTKIAVELHAQHVTPIALRRAMNGTRPAA